MLDLQRIIILCLPSLLFAATVEPGKYFVRKTPTCTFLPILCEANFSPVMIVLKCVLRLNVEHEIEILCVPIGTVTNVWLVRFATNVSCPWATSFLFVSPVRILFDEVFYHN
jgi:hypothetical protein